MEEILNYLIENGKAWIISQRELHRPQAKALPSGIKKRFGPYFPSDLLELARIRHAPRIENPGFFATLEQIGQPIQFDFRRTAGITFFDTILIAKTARTPADWILCIFTSAFTSSNTICSELTILLSNMLMGGRKMDSAIPTFRWNKRRMIYKEPLKQIRSDHFP